MIKVSGTYTVDLLVVLNGVLTTSIPQGSTRLAPKATIELLANYIVEVSFPTIILFSVIRKDVGNLYKWLTFHPEGFHQSQILHADAKSASDEGFGPKRLPFM